MKRIIIYTLVCLALTATRAAAQEDPYYQQDVHYTIKCRLDVKNHRLTGTETVMYTNNSPDTLKNFYMHLYPNAYMNKETPFGKDYRRRFNYTFLDLPEKYRSETRLVRFSIDGTTVSPSTEGTIASMILPQPLAPGDSILIDLAFDTKIRQHLGRAGYKDKHYDMAQWYPKVVVYDQDGWHPDQFMTGEFYGEFGTYDVHITIPENYVVAATGVVQSGDPGWTLNEGRRNRGDKNTNKTIHFRAEKVHDFAWCADPDYVVEQADWNGVKVYSFYRKENRGDWRDRNMQLTLESLDWLQEKVGTYPYPQVSVCDALLSGGMEYPMLVMDGKVDESLVLHEVGHIFFYGILGNNERADAWLDEGFTTMQTSWFMMNKYGPDGDQEGWGWYKRWFPHGDELKRKRDRVFALQRTGYNERVGLRAEEFQNSYRTHVYDQAALIFFALKYVVGDETFEAILKKYFEEWQFKHVNEERFRAICEEVSGQELTWFFNEWLYSRKICDYSLESVKSTASGGGYIVEVAINRNGEVIMPLELEFEFEDGTKQTTRIEGRLREIRETFTFPQRPKKTAVNPNNEIMDLSLADNFVPRRRSLQVDWPNNHYYPEDSQQIRHRPWAWYNDVDGGRVGYVLKSSYYNWSKRMRLAGYYGIDSERMDFDASITQPFFSFGNNGTNTLSGYKIEGRQDVTYELNVKIRDSLIKPPTHQVVFGINYHELTDTRYPRDQAERYQTGADFAPYFGYRVNPQSDIFMNEISFDLRLGRKWFGGKWDYSNFKFEMVSRTRPSIVPFDFGMRFFVGTVGGSMPYQQKHYIAAGGPLAEDQVFFMRSVGAVPEELHYHVPGGGNVRGYNEGQFGVNTLFAFNTELAIKVPLLSRPPNKWWGSIKIAGFGDIAATTDETNPIGTSERTQFLTDEGVLNKPFIDAGAGVRWHRRFGFWDMHVRVDVPAWVNQPIINGETAEQKRRYVFSFSTLF